MFKVCVVFTVLLNCISCNQENLANQRISSYDPCWTDQDCKVNSFCYGNDDTVQGKCKCLNGYELIRNSTYYECLPSVNLGEACEIDMQCQLTAGPLSQCNKYKICDCQSIAHPYTDNICYIIVKIGDVCLVDPNCYLSNNKYGYCTRGVCSCPLNQRPSANRSFCISSRNLGETCLSNEECQQIPNAECMEVCRCEDGYTQTRNQSSCARAAKKLGDECAFDGQCSKYLLESICVDRKCTCLPDFHTYKDNRCVRSKQLGQNCGEDAECIIEEKLQNNVECKKNVCSCIFGSESGVCNIKKTLDSNSSIKLYSIPVLLFVYAVILLQIIRF